MFDMFGNIMKNLFSKPATRMYPFEKREAFKDSRGQVGGIEIDKCIFCGICARKCPADAITVDKNEKSWVIDRFKCVICGECAVVCPKKCILMNEAYTAPAYNKEKSKHVQQPKAPAKDEQASA